jgi:hypothetical protein
MWIAEDVSEEQVCGWAQQDREQERQEYEVRTWLRSTDIETIHAIFDVVCGGSDEAIELYDKAFKSVLSGKTFDLRDEILPMLLDEYKFWSEVAYK